MESLQKKVKIEIGELVIRGFSKDDIRRKTGYSMHIIQRAHKKFNAAVEFSVLENPKLIPKEWIIHNENGVIVQSKMNFEK